VSAASGPPKGTAAGGDRVPGTGASPGPPLATTGRPAEQQRDTGDRLRPIRFELSPKTLVVLVLVVASLWLLIRLWPVLLVLVVALLVAGTLSPAVRWLEEKGVRRGKRPGARGGELLYGHPVLYTLHTVYIVGEFGGQAHFGCVAGLATQCNHTLLRGDRGIEDTGRAVI